MNESSEGKGKTVIITQDEKFLEGYKQGYRYYVTTCSHLPILDTGMYEFIVGTILSVKHSGRWNVGAIVGWVAALLGQEQNEQELPFQIERRPTATHKDSTACQ